jgi:hypothetical protein
LAFIAGFREVQILWEEDSLAPWVRMPAQERGEGEQGGCPVVKIDTREVLLTEAQTELPNAKTHK